MNLSIKEIRESGLLELYVLGDLDQNEMDIVTSALEKYPVLKQDLDEIERSLEAYALSNAVNPPPAVWDKISSEIGGDSSTESASEETAPPAKNGSIWKYFLVGITLAGSAWAAYKYINELKSDVQELELKLNECELESGEKDNELQIFAELQDNKTEISKADPTDKYPDVDLYVFNNEELGKTYLQIYALPELTDDQSFQLWSLKDGLDPIPLDVFRNIESGFLELEHVENTNAYAITIEPKEGSTTPTLSNLIGVFNITG